MVVLIVVLAGGGGSEGGTPAAQTIASEAPATTATTPAPKLLPVPARKATAKLRLQRAESNGYEELLVSLPDERLNTLQTNAGEPFVLLLCADRDGRQLVRQRWDYPLVVEQGFPPHIHQPALPKVLDGVRSCRLRGRGIAFAGAVRGRVPRLAQ